MSELKALINALLRHWAWIWNAQVVGVRYAAGRLFIFRDRPDWFVKDTAELLEAAKTELPDKVPLFQQAVDEWALRQRRANAAAGQAIPPSVAVHRPHAEA